MKKTLIGILMSALFFISGFSQTGIDNTEQAEKLLRKGKIQQVTGIIITSVGFGGIILGAALFKEPDFSTLIYNVKATVVTAAGLGASIIGLINLTSGNKKIKSANLFLNSEHLGITPEFKSKELLVSIGVRINL